MGYREFYKDIEKKKFKNLYLLYGEEKFLIDSMLEKALNILLDKEFLEFNKTVLVGEELNFAQLMNSISTMPMMSESRVVIINEANFINKSVFSSSQEKEFLKYVSDDNCMSKVFIVMNKIDKRKAIVKNISKVAGVVDFTKLEERELKIWVSKEFKQRNVEINMNVVNEFINGSGYFNIDYSVDLYSLLNSIKRLSSRFEGTKINIDDVRDEFKLSSKSNIFNMIDALFTQNSKSTYLNYDLLKSAGEADMKIFFMIHRHVRELIKVKKMLDLSMSRNEIMTRLKLKAFVLDKYISQVAKFDLEQLISILEILVEADNRMKLGSKDTELTINLVINSILNN